MSNSSYDAQAENTFMRAMLNGVEFVSLYEHITPEMIYGHMLGDGNWYSVGVKHIYEAIRSLYPDIKSVPTKEMLINRLRQRPMPVTGVAPEIGIAFLERFYTEAVPTSAEATDARIRVYKAYAYRYAGGLLTRAAEMMRVDDPDAVLNMLSRSSTIKADKTSDYDITNYANTLAQRQERLRSQARGDDPTVIRIPFGIRGLDIETGGMQPGDLIIGALGPGRGKSIALNDSCAFNTDLGHTCVLFTKEMNAYEQGIRFDSRFTGIPHPRYFAAALSVQEMQTWESKIKGLNGKLIIVTVKRNFTPQRVAEVLGNLDWEYDIRAVYLDYLNLMEPNDEKHRNKPEWEKGGILCEELKEVAQERLNPFVTMCQLKPQSINKNRITYDDIAAAKLAVAANANVVFAILADEWAKSVGKSYLQILKIRHRTPDKDCYDMFPQLDYIRIDSNVHNLPNHPAPVMPQMFKDLSLTAARGEQKPQQLTVLDGNGQPISIKPSGDS
jgi:replicative DNA helicase